MDQNADHERGNRLADRHRQVTAVTAHAVSVLFAGNPAAVEHDQAVGPRLVEEVGQRGTVAEAIELERLQAARGRSDKLPQPSAATDAGRRQQLAGVKERPAVPGWALPVLQRDPAVDGRRKADHDAGFSSGGGYERAGQLNPPSPGGSGGVSAAYAGTALRMGDEAASSAKWQATWCC